MRRTTIRVFALFTGWLAIVAAAVAQAPPTPDLLEHLSGHWVLRGTITGQATTHDVDAEWVLNRGYLRLHEVSREKDASGNPQYEAIVFFSRDRKTGEYSCLWLDTTSNAGLSNSGVAHGKASGNEIPFVFFPNSKQEFHNRFAYDVASDSWTWTMDGVEGGKTVPFARLKLTRK